MSMDHFIVNTKLKLLTAVNSKGDIREERLVFIASDVGNWFCDELKFKARETFVSFCSIMESFIFSFKSLCTMADGFYISSLQYLP